MNDMLLVLLSITRENPETSIDEIANLCRASRDPLEAQFRALAEKNLLLFNEASGRIYACQRLALAVEAIQTGSDIERVSRLLTWQEFEEVARENLERSGFSTKKHVVFTWNQRRQEIDLLGMKEPIVISVDCKHWRRNQPGTLARAAMRQLDRTNNLRSALSEDPNVLGVGTWRDIRLVPVVVSMGNREIPFSCGVPIVPILRLRSFLMEIDPFIPGLSVLQVDPRDR